MNIENSDEITFDIEASEKSCAFFALYAGLRWYRDMKKASDPPHSMSLAGAEAHVMLEHLKEKWPESFNDAELEYEEIYVDQQLKQGDKVIMVGCIEAIVYDGKVWKCSTDSIVVKGEIVVSLIGFPGTFLRKNLKKL